MKKFYWLFFNLGLSTVHVNIWRFFAQRVSAKMRVTLTCICIMHMYYIPFTHTPSRKPVRVSGGEGQVVWLGVGSMAVALG